MTKYHKSIISIGSNMGDRLSNCQKGIDALALTDKIFIEAESNFYKTEPVDYLDQDWFANCAVKIKTVLDPFELLNELKRIEATSGRKSGPIRFGPRILDLDLIFFDDILLQTPDLIIPHPRMHKRRFVLVPLCDIEPDILHPLYHKDIKTILDQLDENGQKVYRLA